MPASPSSDASAAPSSPRDRLRPAARHLSLRARLLLRLCVVLAVLFGLGGSAWLALAQSNRQMAALVSDALRPVAELGRIQNDYADALNAVTHASMARLPSAVDIASDTLQSEQTDIRRRWNSLVATPWVLGHRSWLAAATAHRQALDASLKQSLDLLKAGNFDMATLQVSSDTQSAFSPLHADFSNMFEQSVASGSALVMASQRQYHRLGWLLGLLTLWTAAGLLCFDSWLIHSMSRRLASAIQQARTVASGQLGQPFAPGPADEIGHVLRALQQMDQALASVVEQVRGGAHHVQQASEQSASESTALRDRSLQQSRQLQASSQAVDRISDMLARSKAHHSQACSAAEAAADMAGQGRELALAMQASMQQIQGSGHSLSGIVEHLDQMALKSRLLALNAAVEAAHAGEHGRGFAVVAEEVGRLAKQTAEALIHAQQLLADNQVSIQHGTSRAIQCSELLDQIAERVQHLQQSMLDIDRQSRQQHQEATQISAMMRALEALTERHAEAADKAHLNAEGLQSQARLLLQKIGFFRQHTAETA
ncbi:methyl-accepting chemotaxis protein [Frateuria aurantia]